ncbi:unnamed protein product [Paramecium sonneborni]|uniref:Protein kinase domain-containing protein n=1 Tax=Paramecium sonneborni TaxID=65129 RepID=A0A8S1KBG4_9CILI|nr:unnamed protein product [Paramecium sonneborni]
MRKINNIIIKETNEQYFGNSVLLIFLITETTSLFSQNRYFSLGILLYELLKGRQLPFRGYNAQDLLKDIETKLKSIISYQQQLITFKLIDVSRKQIALQMKNQDQVQKICQLKSINFERMLNQCKKRTSQQKRLDVNHISRKKQHLNSINYFILIIKKIKFYIELQMGNQICWCYADEQEPTASQNYQNINQTIQDDQQNISLQLNKKQQEIKIEPGDQNILNKFGKSNINSQRENELPLNNFILSKIKQKDIKYEPQIIHFNDPLSNIVSTWFQSAIAQTKFIQNIHISEKLKNNNFDQEIRNKEDLQTLICLKWCVVDYFKEQKIPENVIIRKCFKMFYKAVHYCINFKKLFLENQSNDCKENIQLYLNLYQYFQRIMNTFAKKYEIYVNIMQQMYKNQFNFINQFKQYPFFQVIGYMMRFWCQIMLSDDVQNKLNNNFQSLLKSDNQILIYQYVIYALDVNINEYNVHWIGHRKNFKYEKRLLIQKPFVEDQQQKSEYSICIDHLELAYLKNQYPLWYFQFEIEYKIIKSKFINLLKNMKYNKEIQIDSNLKKQILDSELLEQSEEQQNSLKQNNSCEFKQQSDQNYENQLITLKNDFSDNCQSLDETDELLKKKKRLSYISTESSYQESIDAQTNFSSFNKQKLSDLKTELINIEKKFQEREFILQQRAKKLKLKPDEQIEWLNYFAKTSFDKIPDSKFQLKEYIKQILNKLSEQDNYYKQQLQDFI